MKTAELKGSFAGQAMGKVIRFANDNRQCWARINLANGDPIWISVASRGTIIRVKRSRLGLFGPVLYSETNPYKAAGTAMALDRQVQQYTTPEGMIHPVLRAFTQAAIEADSAAALSARLNTALESDPEAFINSVASEARRNPANPHVYTFAYTTLPQALFANPHDVTEDLWAGRWRHVVDEAWADANALCKQKGIGPNPIIEGLRFQTLNESFGSIFLLVFPEPKAVPEPYAIAITAGYHNDDPVGYFTLEHTMELGDPCTSAVVGQITTSCRLNLGTMKPANLTEFRKVVARHASELIDAAVDCAISQVTPEESEKLVYSFADVLAEHSEWILDARFLPATRERLYSAFDCLIQRHESVSSNNPDGGHTETLEQLKALRCRVASFQVIDADDVALVQKVNAGPNIAELAKRLADGTVPSDQHANAEQYVYDAMMLYQKYNRRAMEESGNATPELAA